MKKILILIVTTALLISCSSKSSGKRKAQRQVSNNIEIEFVDSVDGRPTYNVYFPDGRALDQMYPEEIAQGLIDGNWQYNEFWMITNIKNLQ